LSPVAVGTISTYWAMAAGGADCAVARVPASADELVTDAAITAVAKRIQLLDRAENTWR
jgi:hypothetical protein